MRLALICVLMTVVAPALFVGPVVALRPQPAPPPPSCSELCACAGRQLVCAVVPGPIEGPLGCMDECECTAAAQLVCAVQL